MSRRPNFIPVGYSKCTHCSAPFPTDGRKRCHKCRNRNITPAQRARINELCRVRQKQKYQQNKEYFLQRAKLWRDNHPEEWKAIHDGWKKLNAHKIAAYRQNRKYRERGAICDCEDKKFCKEQIAKIYQKAQEYTEITGECYEVDHIQPISRSGKHCRRNLQVLTALENGQKAANF